MQNSICNNNNSNNIIIYNVMRKLGFRPNNCGTIFILRAVQLVKQQNDIVILNDIYIELSKASVQFSPNQIKMAIKYAIDHRNEQKTISNFKEIFGYDYDEEVFTNKDLIEELARVL